MTESAGLATVQVPIGSDAAITTRAADLLDRAPLAQMIADQFEATGAESFVLSVMGPWGTGKTSFINMVDEALQEKERIVPLRFEPWLFSGTDQLFNAFFEHIASQLKINRHIALNKVGDAVEKYGDVLSKAGPIPVVGPFIAAAGLLGLAGGRGLKLATDRKLDEIDQKRQALEKLLSPLEYKLVTIVDDIDRLHGTEIVSIVRLVRVLARLPNTHYLLSLDRRRVEEALDEGVKGRGRAYLEKVVQSAYDLPAISRDRLRQLLLDRLTTGLQAIRGTRRSSGRWSDLFDLAILPLLSSLRDVDRYVNAALLAMRQVGDEVAIEDVLTLEAIRVFLPDAFAALAKLADCLTTTSADRIAMFGDTWKRQLEALVTEAGVDGVALEESLRRLFPAAERYFDPRAVNGSELVATWRRDRRVAEISVLRYYLERTLRASQVPTPVVERVLGALADAGRLAVLLQEVPDGQLGDLLIRLLDHADGLTPDHALPAFVGLASALPRLPRDTWGRDGTANLVERLIERIPAGPERDHVLVRMATDAPNLSAGALLAYRLAISGQEGPLVAALAHRQSGMAAADLALERELPLLLGLLSSRGELAPERLRAICDDDDLFLRLLEAHVTRVHGPALGGLAQTTTSDPTWPPLLEQLGSDYLVTRSRALLAGAGARTLTDHERAALKLFVYRDSGL